MTDGRLTQRSRRSLLKAGILATIATATSGAVVTAISALSRSGPRGVQILQLVATRGRRPVPARYLEGDPKRWFYVTEVPGPVLERVRNSYPPATRVGIDAGLLALSRRCPHLKNSTNWCESSQWFECPAHGSRFNALGEWKDGPAKAGMALIEIRREPDGSLMAIADAPMEGMPQGTDTTGQRSEGPHCVTGAERGNSF